MRRTKMRRQSLAIRAFTLAESLLVLSLICFVTILFAGGFGQVVRVVKGELFVLQFEHLLKETQADAAILGSSENFAVRDNDLFWERNELEIPEVARVDDFSLTFDGKGENSSLKKLKIFLPAEHKTVIYQMEMGSGKFKKSIS